ARSGAAAARSTGRGRNGARLRQVRRLATSGGGPVAGDAARRPAACADQGRPAQDRGLDGAAWRGHRGVAGQAGRPVLQRQPPRRPCERRAYRGATSRPVAFVYEGIRLIIGLRVWVGRTTMKVFLISCAVAIIVAVGAVYTLGGFQRQADVAFSSKSGVRL